MALGIDLLTLQTLYTDRGYTGHLHADGVGLIHMNGRMYDPILGRFISADPLIQSPNNLQSLNRYSYVMNNPLSYTDPTGYSWSKFRDKWLKPIAVVALAVYTGGLAAGALTPTISCTAGLTMTQTIAMAATSSAVMGGGMTLVNGGSFKDATKNAFKGAVTGAISGAMFGGIASAYATPQGSQWALGRVGWNAAAGGTSSIMSDGSFKDGAKIAGLFAASAYTYNKLVEYDATWESGDYAVDKRKNAMPNQYRNNIGFQGQGVGNPKEWFLPKSMGGGLDLREGGAISSAVNKIPGINAVAGLHDVFQVGWGKLGDQYRNNFFLNVGGMGVATVATAPALLSDPNALHAYFQHKQSKNIRLGNHNNEY